MAKSRDMKDYHCTKPCGEGECIFKGVVTVNTQLPAQEGNVHVHVVSRDFMRLPYGLQRGERYWEVFAKNGGANSELIRFHCTKESVRKPQAQHIAPPALRHRRDFF